MLNETNPKILLVSPGYPSKENPYNNSFVHQRVIGYKEEEVNIAVFSIVGSPYKKNMKRLTVKKYQMDDVDVYEGTHGDLENHLEMNNYDKILIHFAWKGIMEVILDKAKGTPLYIWVHGVEALSWKRRLFNFSFNPTEMIKFFGYIPYNRMQLNFLGKFIDERAKLPKNKTTFIFVSQWMKDILEEDTRAHHKIENFRIIPNVINEKLFSYHKKDSILRFNIFNIRPYHSKKYANDIMVDVILKLKEYKDFKKLKFHLFGDGKLFDETVKPLEGLSNVFIKKKMLSQKEIALKHKENGILLMPTRQDAQGVSMCEAMSSGLVPVVSNNTAIPEYVKNDFGYLCNTSEEMATAIINLVENKEMFQEKSKKASEFIQAKCAIDVVLKEELELLNSEEF